MRAWQLQPVYMCSCLMIIWFSFQVSSTYTVLHLRIHSVKYDTKVLNCGRAQKFYIYSHPSVGGGGLRSSDPHIRYETIRCGARGQHSKYSLLQKLTGTDPCPLLYNTTNVLPPICVVTFKTQIPSNWTFMPSWTGKVNYTTGSFKAVLAGNSQWLKCCSLKDWAFVESGKFTTVLSQHC